MAILKHIKTLEEYSKQWLSLQYLWMAFIPSIMLLSLITNNSSFRDAIYYDFTFYLSLGIHFLLGCFFYVFLFATIMVALRTNLKTINSKIMVGISVSVIVISVIFYLYTQISMKRFLPDLNSFNFLIIHYSIGLGAFIVGMIFALYTFLSTIATRLKTKHSIYLFLFGLVNIAIIIIYLIYRFILPKPEIMIMDV